jgi:predicted MFS family arabinose efflux permease
MTTTNSQTAVSDSAVDQSHDSLPNDLDKESSPPAETTRDSSQDGEAVEKPAANEEEVDPLNSNGLIMGRTKGKVALIMLALCMAVFLAALDVTIITTALPVISEHFQSASGYTWIGSSFLLANASSIPVWGKVSDIFGRKPMLLAANVIFLVGSLVAALSYSIGMLIAARAVQGIGAGGLIILVNIIIGDLFPLNIRGAFYGVIGGVWAIASSLGPIIGGAFTQGVSWRWCFW